MTIYEKYVANEKQIEALEEVKKLLREEMTKELPEDGFKDATITASWKTTKKWTYSPVVKAIEVKVKEVKAELTAEQEKEETEGIAKCEESKSLLVTVK